MPVLRIHERPSKSGDPHQRRLQPQAYARDDFGWHGHRIEQLMNVIGKRTSVSTVLILQRGPILLALDYTNYTPKAPEQTLRAYNLGVLRKIVARPA